MRASRLYLMPDCMMKGIALPNHSTESYASKKDFLLLRSDV